MKVFISWSGDQSLAVAQALRDWLPQVIQAVDPWISVSDIEKGSRWAGEIAGQLEECRVGLICLTPKNLSAPWLLFEAGALAKTLDKTFVCPYLLDLQYSDVRDPLAQFQLTRADEEDTRKLLRTINRAVALVANEQALSEVRLHATFEKWWPDLESTPQHIPSPSGSVPQKRSERELLEEILEGVRGLTRSLSSDLQEIRTLSPWVPDEELRRFAPFTSIAVDKFLASSDHLQKATELFREVVPEQERRQGAEGKDAPT
jgi:hypothetical protein